MLLNLERIVGIHLVMFVTCTMPTILSPSARFCPGDEVNLSCEVSGLLLTWRVSLPDVSIPVFTTTYISSQHSVGLLRQGGPNEGFIFNLTSKNPFTSTLTTIADAALDDTVIECAGTSVTLNQQGTPPPAINPTSMMQTAGTTSAVVAVQWTASAESDVSYTVSVTPDLPSLGGPVTTTDTSLELQDVPYNTEHTVSVMAINCAGGSVAAETAFRIAGCVVPEPPVNGDWQTFSPSTTVGPGTNLSLSCSPGYVPSEVMSSTCQSDGRWMPNTVDISCMPVTSIECGPPEPPVGVVGAQVFMGRYVVGSTFSFRCAEGLFPNTTHEAVCGADGQWRPDPANHACGDSTEIDCGASQPPASGSIAPYSSTLDGAVISFQCDQGFSPPEERTATCVRDEDTASGAWTPDPAQHTCTIDTVDCGAPQPPANGFIKTMTSTILGAVVSFQCDQGFSPPEDRPATCVRDAATGSAVWEPSPAEHTCVSLEATSLIPIGSSKISEGLAIAVVTTAAMCTLLCIGSMIMQYCFLAHKAKYKVSNNDQSEKPPIPAPVYEEINEIHPNKAYVPRPKVIALTENPSYASTSKA